MCLSHYYSVFKTDILISNCYYSNIVYSGGSGAVVIILSTVLSLSILGSSFFNISLTGSDNGGCVYYYPSSGFLIVKMTCSQYCMCGFDGWPHGQFMWARISQNDNMISESAFSMSERRENGLCTTAQFGGNIIIKHANYSFNNQFRCTAALLSEGSTQNVSYTSFFNNTVLESRCIQFHSIESYLQYSNFVGNDSPVYGIITTFNNAKLFVSFCSFQNNSDCICYCYLGSLNVDNSYSDKSIFIHVGAIINSMSIGTYLFPVSYLDICFKDQRTMYFQKKFFITMYFVSFII